MKRFKFKINGSEFEVSVNEVEKNVAEIEVNGTPFTVEIEKQEKTSVSTINRKPAGKVDPIPTPSKPAASSLKAPLPGSIIKVLVSPGQAVKKGDVLLTMESMKMENNILAESDAVVGTVHVKPGQNVMQDDLMIEFSGAPAQAEPTVAPAPVAEAPKSSGVKKTVKSPLPGSVIKVVVAQGQSVKKGDVLLVLESMKMENNILAENDAVVSKIYVQGGQQVMQDDALIDLE
jgi:biotin carboxyl carrier protein